MIWRACASRFRLDETKVVLVRDQVYQSPKAPMKLRRCQCRWMAGIVGLQECWGFMDPDEAVNRDDFRSSC